MQIPKEWLTERVENVPTSYRSMPPKAALRSRMAWQKLKGRMEEGDELWSFVSPASTWKRRSRYMGFALIRDGQILDTAMVEDE